MSAPDATMKAWQQKLIDAATRDGVPNPLPQYGADGLGGTETRTAILDFQARHGLATTGQFDDATRKALNPPVEPDYSLGRAFLPLILTYITKGAIPMTADQITGVIRAILTAVGGIFVTRGWIGADTLNEVIGAVLTLGGAVWSIYSNRPKTIVPIAAK